MPECETPEEIAERVIDPDELTLFDKALMIVVVLFSVPLLAYLRWRNDRKEENDG